MTQYTTYSGGFKNITKKTLPKPIFLVVYVWLATSPFKDQRLSLLISNKIGCYKISNLILFLLSTSLYVANLFVCRENRGKLNSRPDRKGKSTKLFIIVRNAHCQSFLNSQTSPYCQI